MTAPLTVVHIISTSYAGSTWLNLMLGAHAKAFSVGELKSLRKLGRAVCSVHGDACPVWSTLDLAHSEEAGANPLTAIGAAAGKPVLVINNSRRFAQHQRAPAVRARWIHLVRDGRAVAASFLRKFPEHGMWRVAREVARAIRRNRRLLRRQPRDATASVRYEDLVEHPDRELERLCGFAGLDYDPAMRSFWEGDPCFLGGNRGVLTSVVTGGGAREAALPPSLREQRGEAALPRWDADFYRGVDPKRFRDERWKQELTDAQLRVFGLLAGWGNRRLGYPRSLDRYGAKGANLEKLRFSDDA